ncbi:MAG: acyltransferase family protein [Clostridia bacterium]|nr:acyltransferase family protein [Clostridia bacterium]
MDNGRIIWADLSKGILILLVIVGHVFQSTALHNFLSSFYMPCFFIVSGFFMRNISQKDFFKKLFFGILIYYFVFAVSGSISMLTICSFIKKLLFISFIGRYSVLYYGLHYFFVSVFSFLLTKCNIANIFIREALIFFLVLLFTSATVVLFITIKKLVEAKYERAIN